MKRISRRSAKPRAAWLAAAVLALGVAAPSARAQYSSGNLVVEQIGATGSATALSSASTAVFLDQYSAGGTSVNSLAIPTTGTGQLTNSGSASSEGLVTTSENGLLFALAGYQTGTGTATVASTAGIVRTIDTVDGSGTVSNPVSASDSVFFQGNNFRSAVTDGQGNYWGTGATSNTSGSTGGVNYFGTASAASSVETGSSSMYSTTRQANIFAGAAGGQLYYSTGSGTQGIYAVGSGTPITSGQTASVFLSTKALGGGSSPYAFSFNTSLSVAYVADSTAGIQKYTSSNNGGTWTLAGTYANVATGTAGTTGLTVDWSNPSKPVVYASSPTTLYKLIDSGGTGTATFSETSLATAATNTAFRGLALALPTSTWTVAAANNSTTNWVTATAATQYSNFSTIQAKDSNIAFQNVNSAASALNLTVNNNNSSFTSVSSLGFTAGYGTSTAGTAYTLTGNALTLSGTAASSAVGTFSANSSTYVSVVANNSAATQTVNVPLTLGAANQAFRAVTAPLVIGGTVTNGGYALTVGGTYNTTLNGAISGIGGLTKVEGGTATLTTANGFSGATTVSGGTLTPAATSGQALGGTTQVTVNKSGTLLFGASNQIAANANVGLGGGVGMATLNTGGFSQDTNNRLGALTLAGTAAIDFGSGHTTASTLAFADSSGQGWSGTLSVLDYSGTVYQPDGMTTSGTPGDALFLGTSASGLSASQLAEIQFVNPAGYTGTFGAFIDGNGEVFAQVPEPATVLGGLLMVGALGWTLRRRSGRRMVV